MTVAKSSMLSAFSFPILMLKTVADLEKASDAVLRAYLSSEKVPFSATALRPELLADARAHMTKENAKEKPSVPKVEEPNVIMEKATIEELLQQLHARGFRDREECIAIMNAVERDKTDLKNQRAALVALQEELNLRELHFADRVQALEKKAEEVRKDMQKQAELYEKLEALKGSFPAGASLDV